MHERSARTSVTRPARVANSSKVTTARVTRNPLCPTAFVVPAFFFFLLPQPRENEILVAYEKSFTLSRTGSLSLLPFSNGKIKKEKRKWTEFTFYVFVPRSKIYSMNQTTKKRDFSSGCVVALTAWINFGKYCRYRVNSLSLNEEFIPRQRAKRSFNLLSTNRGGERSWTFSFSLLDFQDFIPRREDATFDPSFHTFHFMYVYIYIYTRIYVIEI